MDFKNNMQMPPALVAAAYKKRGAVVHTDKGTVIVAEHGKFLLVVNTSGGVVHTCVINTEKNKFAPPNSQVAIDDKDMPWIGKDEDSGKDKVLTHVSYVDCSKMFDVDEEDFGKAIENGKFQPKGFLDETSMCYVLDAGQNCKTLRPFERKYFE